MLPMEIISPFSLILNVAINVLENDASLMLCTAFFVASADRSLVLAGYRHDFNNGGRDASVKLVTTTRRLISPFWKAAKKPGPPVRRA